MDPCRPLTAPQPWEEIPPGDGFETLFPELPPSGARPVEVTVTVPDGDSRRVVMDIVTAEANAGDAFGLAFRACSEVEGFEVTARPFPCGRS